MASQRVGHDWATSTFTYRTRRYIFKISEMDEASGNQKVWNQNTACKITPFKSLQWWEVDHSLSLSLLVPRQRQSVLWLTRAQNLTRDGLILYMKKRDNASQVWISVVPTKCLTANEVTGFRHITQSSESHLGLQQTCRRKCTGVVMRYLCGLA